ncbi:MAG: nodulation protein NfeD [Acidobacteria bacterium]|nr:nodulation protein NfeD [Acidobacteriota bacterium]
MIYGFAGRFTHCAALVLGLTLTIQSSSASTAQTAPPVVYAAIVDSIIHPVSAEYIAATLDRADEAGAALVVLTLRTPGGLVESTRAIVSRMVAGRTPVAVFVAPSGARAASAGFILILAADVAAMAPGTHIGAAHPVDGSGQKMDDTVAAKAASDLAAYARTLATARHRNVALAAEAVNQSRAFTEGEARDADPPLIDLVATDLRDLLRQLDGRTITRFDGTTTVLHTADATVVPIEMTLRQRVLSAVAHPNVAYLLMSLGTLALTIELWNPGAVLPGVVGGLCLLLAFFAFSVLPVNVAGVLLVVFGLVLLGLELVVTSFGLLTVGGLVSLVFGSMMLVDSPLPELQVSANVIVPVVLGFAAIGAALARLGIAAQRQPAATGASAMVGEPGEALTAIDEHGGQVSTHGEIWQATAAESIPKGSRVRITHAENLRLQVRKD